ncbi:thiamine phosphate synthase [Selenomonas artemidis]|uniref:Thiamine-phosphate synthase n=1 Tax=Selenomonas artemidis F0399 TaxID=749551 RepID=E7N062_9FIRM|nr:thiamine phosphate synthase [Selenomonas artemidis]EFW30726.1 putative thiamine-phosphate diphosphorylase [Selenomonas artemidis F0399]MBF1682569.1 thiamine phosphate synthase [Selenomonas artemidis]
MSMRKNFDLSAYLVIGPENTNGRPAARIIAEAVRAGFTFVQIRSKTAEARELIDLTRAAAEIIAAQEKSERVALVVNDRLDVVLAARDAGVKVGGIHVGQSDIPPEICRKYLGADAIVGLSARTSALIDYVRTCDTSCVDYFGAGPLHPTATKPDAGRDAAGHVVTRTIEELAELHRVSPLPVVVGGGVKAADLPALRATGVEGFFVVSTIAGAAHPFAAAEELVHIWRSA